MCNLDHLTCGIALEAATINNWVCLKQGAQKTSIIYIYI